MGGGELPSHPDGGWTGVAVGGRVRTYTMFRSHQRFSIKIVFLKSLAIN